MEFGTEYIIPDTPQEVRNDFVELMEISMDEELILALANYLPSDTLASFISDRLMGRV